MRAASKAGSTAEDSAVLHSAPERIGWAMIHAISFVAPLKADEIAGHPRTRVQSLQSLRFAGLPRLRAR
jgi:hypothetical protein